MLAVGAVDAPSIRFMNAATGQTVLEVPTPESVAYAAWSADDQYLAVVTHSQVNIHRWPALDRVTALTRWGPILSWHPIHQWLVASTLGALMIVRLERPTELRPTIEVQDPVDAVWLPDDALVVGTRSGFFVHRETGARSGQAHPGIAVAASQGASWALGGRGLRVVTPTEGLVELAYTGAQITALAFSPDARLLASRSVDGDTAIWDLPNRRLLHSWKNASPTNTFRSIAFSPVDNLLATPVAYGSQLAIFRVNPDAQGVKSTFYTTAKIALVGDSGVGKTGLGWRLAHGEFKHHESTHGEQFWVVDNISTVRDDGAQCEAVLFDLAGQPDYRLTNTLFLDDVDVALVVVDPTNGDDPLKGAQFWLRALRRSARTILVPARSDRGQGVLTDEMLRRFAEKEGITGGVVVTSAKLGEGIDELLVRIRAEVDWNARPATVTTETFKAIKDHVLALKEAGGKTGVLVTPKQLRDAVSDAAKTDFALDDVTAAARHLANHGYIRELRGSRGDEWILLAPQLLHNLAASIVLEARRNPKGLGALDERRLLAGEHRFPELDGLAAREREILIDAAAALFIEHNVCFREALGNDVFLVFPSLINQNRPQLDEQPTVDGTAYTVSGATESVYPALVVLLGYTNTFTRTNQWKNNARYEVVGHVCGFRQTDEREGAVDLVLYFGESAPLSARQLFQGLFETFLAARPVTFESFPPIVCPSCAYGQPRTEVMKRRRDGKSEMFCANCGARVAIGGAERTPARDEDIERNRRVAAGRTQFHTVLSSLKGYLRDINAASPTCFLSYAHGVPDDERWVENLAADLKTSGINVVLDTWHARPGDSVIRFAERSEKEDFIAVIGTPLLRAKYDKDDHYVARELELAAARIGKRSVIPILRSGDPASAFPPLLKDAVQLDFRDDDRYFLRLFELLVRLYGIALDEKAVRDLRDALNFRPA